MNGVIYCIKNLVNEKCYVGQSSRGFNGRYHKGRWAEKTHNYFLKNEVKKYGIKLFEVKILEENVESINELNKLEEKYAIEMNCYYPNGYNLTKCGNNKRMHELTKEKLRLSHKRDEPIFLKEISTQKIIKIDSLCNFCRVNKLNRGNLIKVIYNKNYSVKHLESQGYCLPETTMEQLESITVNKYTRKEYVFRNRNGEKVKMNFLEFCKKYNIQRKKISNLIRGSLRVVGDWTLENNTFKEERSKYRNSKFYFNKKEIIIKNLALFCRENNLDFSSMIKILKGKKKSHKGYSAFV